MRTLLVAACGLLGLVTGVGVNVLIDRVPRKLRLRPFTEGCRLCLADQRGWVGWPLPGGRCRSCDRPLTARYLWVPVANGVLFAATAARFGPSWVLPAYLVFFASLLTVSVIDLEHHIIPNRIVYPTIFVSVPLLAMASALDGNWHHFGQALIGAGAAWGALLAIHLVSPGGMGFGDVRLAFVLGLFLGWLGLSKVITGLFLGFLLGAVIGLALIGLGVRGRRDHIPFGPFLAAGTALAVFFGGPLAGLLTPG